MEKRRRVARGGKAVAKDEALEFVERFRVDVQFAIQRIMMEENISQSELAARLHMSQPRVSQFFGRNSNLTLKTLARVFHALGDECFVWSPKLDALAREGKVPEHVCGLSARYRVPRYEQPLTVETDEDSLKFELPESPPTERAMSAVTPAVAAA